MHPQTFTEATIAWLQERPHLSPATRASYRGEVDRLAQYLAKKHGVVEVQALTQQQWAQYLDAMAGKREAISTRRTAELAPSSLIQAKRISAQFLLWCARHGLVNWWPSRHPRPSQASPRKAAARSTALPFVVRQALSGQIDPVDTEEARALLTMNLCYWAALDAASVAQLKVRDLVIRGDVRLEVARNGLKVCLPTHVKKLWFAYRQHREDDLLLRPRGEAPLVARMDAEARLQPWSIWALVNRWQRARDVDPPLSPRSIRRAFLDAATSTQGAGLAATVAHAQKATHLVRADPTCYTESIKRIHAIQLRGLRA